MPNFRWPIQSSVTGHENDDGTEQWGVVQQRQPIGNGTMADRASAQNPASFGALGGAGGLLGILQRRLAGGGAAPAVPADGAMPPTIGPGAAPAVAPPAPVKMGLPPGGILGLLQGQSPQGLIGLLQRAMGPQQAAPMAGGMPQAGMLSGLPGTPGSPMAGPMAPPPAPQLPMNINPMDQF